jgi:hypothetical protein
MAPDGKGQLVRAFIGRFGGWLIFPIIVAIAIAAAPFIGSGVALYALMLVVAFILVLTFRQFRYRR